MEHPEKIYLDEMNIFETLSLSKNQNIFDKNNFISKIENEINKNVVSNNKNVVSNNKSNQN